MTTFDNTTEEILETMKRDIESKAVTQSTSNGAHSSIKDVQQKKWGADTKKHQTGDKETCHQSKIRSTKREDK